MSQTLNNITSISTPNDTLRQILDRLVDANQLVQAELAEYSQSYEVDDVVRNADYKLSVIIPVYNEEKTLSLVVSRVAALRNASGTSSEPCFTASCRAAL